MPADVVETPADQSGPKPSQTPDTPPDPDKSGTPDAYLSTYLTREEAEKGLSEKDETINRLKSERDKASAKAEDNDALRALIDKMSAPAATETPQRDLAKIKEHWQQKLEEEGNPALWDLIAAIESEKDVEIKAMLAERDEKVAQQLQELKQLSDARDPSFLPYREKVTELAEEMGLDPVKDRDVLVKVAKKLGPEQPPTPERPGGMQTPALATPESVPPMTEETEAFMNSSKLTADMTPDEKRQLAEKRAANAAALKARGR